MYPGYGEMFSSLGYEALDVILGLDSTLLSELEKRELVRLVELSEKNVEVKSGIQSILENNSNNKTRKAMLLALMSQENM
ncbi:hypothetical protein [Bacillus taeanensis]|uniref:Uncharacterized protein n=1 Tax=Bacillus taeanensis TaxID=273032 RepID=A0A366Y101_9BACI|nr:hypothetical protein [Bacillus taeanensis]RBW70689.1 hypothetical protein DS031_04180 [Bacillus taeanensis]